MRRFNALWVSIIMIIVALNLPLSQSHANNSVLPAPHIVTQGDYSFRVASGKTDTSFKFNYSDRYFYDDSYVYKHDLAKASLNFAMSAFNSATNGQRHANAFNFLNKCGFTNCQRATLHLNGNVDNWYYASQKADTIGVVIGKKEVNVNLSNCTLIAVGVRGAGYGKEWASNFTVGTNPQYHDGFHRSALLVLKYVFDYINSQNISGNIKLWITGYSRAAAVANVAAGKLDAGEYSLPARVSLARNNLYAYTFETPAGVREQKNPRALIYQNIFNVVNVNDPVPRVAFSSWYNGYYRFGRDCFITSPTSKIEQFYNIISNTSGQFKYPFEATDHRPQQRVYLASLANNLASTIGAPEAYVSRFQTDVRNIYIDSGFLGDIQEGWGMLTNAAIISTLLRNMDSVKVLLDNRKAIFFYHYPELCLAYLQSINSISDYNDGRFYYTDIKCPVDVNVYDASNTLIASIVNDAVVLQGATDRVNATIMDSGDKRVYVLDDQQYSLQLSGTADGDMDVTIVSYDESIGKTSQTVYFHLPLTQGSRYSAPLVSGTNILLSNNSGTITPNATLSRAQLGDTSVTAKIVGSGTVYGVGKYSLGDTASLLAIPNVGSTFFGWRENGAFISENKTLYKQIREPYSVTAVFGRLQNSGTDGVPKAGDGTPIFQYALLFVISAAAVVIKLVGRIRRKEHLAE